MGKVEEKVKVYLDRIEKGDKKVNAFLHLNGNVMSDAHSVDGLEKKGKLYGYVFGVKSNINVKDMICNCASKTLENYKSGYDATVVSRIREEDGVIIGMLNMDEFACGSSGESSAFGVTLNPSAPGKITGGSSSGSAAAVAAGFCDVALGSDTGGSIRNPASHCGVVGVKPSYGLVSRYGLIDLSMSLDQIGPLAKNVKDAALVLDVISGEDDKDTTTKAKSTRSPMSMGKVGKVKVGVVRISGVNIKIQEEIDKKVKEIKEKLKWDVKEIKMKHIDLAIQTYYPLVYVEFFSGTRRFDGRKYGKRIEDTCGGEVLRRILGGSEISKAEYMGAYYQKALQVKGLIKQEFKRAFGQVDCLIMPVVPMLPWDVGQGKKMKPEEIYAADALTAPMNLAGVCAVSIPCGSVSGIPVGMQVVCSLGGDGRMLKIAGEIEKV
jgi:aspartyl-tRNA(Asn)/glutamyl-tRNA(Gln) amidotransferase subunit A